MKSLAFSIEKNVLRPDINSLDSCLPPSFIPVKYANDLIFTELLMKSPFGLTQRGLDSVAEWGQEFSLSMNGAETIDMIISARKEDNILRLQHFLVKT